MSNYLFEIAENQIQNYLKELDIYDDLYNKNEVTEIMINTNKKIFVKILGIGFVEKENESNNDHLINLLKILSSLDNQVITGKNPELSTKMILKNGQKVRIEGLIPPVVENPTINIRKQSSILITVEDYLEKGFINEKILEFFKKVVKEHKNILVIGGTDTGKTTLTNSIINLMERDKERIIVIEEVPELQLKSPNVNRIQTIPNILSSLKALKYCMRASPERIVFGEIREGESAYEFINGLNSGHQGGISTIHANDGIGGLKKLEMYINSVFGKPLSEEIGMTIDVLITVKMKNYKRYLASIDICKEYDREKNKYILENFYTAEKIIEVYDEPQNNTDTTKLKVVYHNGNLGIINLKKVDNIQIDENDNKIELFFSNGTKVNLLEKEVKEFSKIKNQILNF